MIGRTAERAALQDVLESARNGFSETLVLSGTAGIGKTALLEYAVDQARDFRVLRITGIESDMELGFAGLYQLLQPVLPDIERLPGPQRAALESAFGLAGGPPPGRFLVGLATLTLLSDTAAQAPGGEALLIAVDDAQWLDQASVVVLAFVARQLNADRVAFVFTVREATGNWEGFRDLTTLRVRGLTPPDVHGLIASLVNGPVAPQVADQIEERTRGNPLALVETARELTGEQLAGAAVLPDPLPLSDDARDVYSRRLAALSPGQREFLLLAAAETSGDPELLEKAAVHLGLDPRLFRDEEISELVTVEDRVVFQHPLIRSAVYAGSPHRERRRVHTALAAVSDPDKDQERAAWHRAAAATEPDEDIAVSLDEAADRATRSGGFSAAATFLRRAAELTPDLGGRGARLLAAAGAEFMAGRIRQAETLLDQAGPDLHDPARLAELFHMKGEIQAKLGQGDQAPVTLLEAARALAPFDPEASRGALVAAMTAAFYASGSEEWTGTYAELRAAHPDDMASEMSVPDLILSGYSALLAEGPAAGGPILRRAVQSLLGTEYLGDQWMRWCEAGIWCTFELLDFAAYRRLADLGVELCRARGTLGELPVALDYLGTSYVFAGRLSDAETANAEGRDILAATGTPDRLGVTSTELLLPAWRGQESELREVSSEMIRDCARRGQRRGTLYPHFAWTVFAIGAGDYAEALARARVQLDENGSFLGTVVLPYAVEAAVRCEDWATAELALHRVIARADAGGTDWGRGLRDQCQAIALRGTGADRDAERESLYTAAIGQLERAGALFDAARTRLLLGEWLRRKRRRSQARTQLRAAWEYFNAIGATAFAGRARLELAAAGAEGFAVRASAPKDSTRSSIAELTERETQVARLVADGATNSEAATKLFISASTVDHHLRHVYRKLGVSSRTQLSVIFRNLL